MVEQGEAPEHSQRIDDISVGDSTAEKVCEKGRKVI